MVVRLLLSPVLEAQRPYLTLFGGIALAIWLTRWKPTAVAAALGFFAAHALTNRTDGTVHTAFFAIEFACYTLSAGMIIWVGEHLHRARERSERETDERHAAEQSERLQKEEFRVTFSSIGDAVITTDTEGKVVTLNPVAEDLTGWREADAQGQPLDTVFRIVNETTRRVAENPALRALREGVIVGLANHTVLLARDGTERPIDDSAAPIRDHRNQVLGCVLVFRDITERRKAEQQIWESRERLRITLASIGDGVIVADTEGRVRSLNAEARRLTGWSEEEATGRPLREVFPLINEESGQPVGNPVENVISQGTVVGLGNHTALVTRDGRRIPIDDSAAPIRELDGPVHGIVMIFRDVSEQRAAQRAKARLASIIENSGDAIFTKDLDGIVQSWNASAERLFGYSQEEIVGKPITLIIPTERLHEEAEILARLRAGKALERFETIRIAKNGRRISVLISVSPLRDEEGRVIGASKIIHDITDVVAAREALQVSEQRFRQMADAAPVLIWVSGTNKMCTWFNQQWLNFVGRTIDQELGIGWAENVHPDDFERCLETYGSAFDAREPFSMTYRLKRHDGNYRWLLDHGVPLYDFSGGFAGYVGSCIDVTEQKDAEAALKEVDRRKDEFLAILSHELRNPLAPITMSVELLRTLGPPDPKLQELRTTIERQTIQLTRLLDDLLDVSRIASGKIILRRERASLGLAIASAVESARPLIDSHDHELIVVVPPEPILVHGDFARLAQVFANLLNNAAKYTEPGGRITLTAKRRGSEVDVAVQDTGIGLSHEQISKIFKMFTQIDPSGERGKSGLGVGLALAKTLVELHGGRIRAESPGLGRGSTFTVSLPLLHDRLAGKDQTDEERSKASTVHRILIADDNHDAAMVLAMALRELGHELAVAHDGEEALEAATRFKPNVAVLDIGMPKRNGFEVAMELRACFGRRMLLVALTGWGKDEDKRKAKEAGFDHHLTKPAGLEAIVGLLDAAPTSGSVQPT